MFLLLRRGDFPSFSEGLSLRQSVRPSGKVASSRFPFLFGGTFIEAHRGVTMSEVVPGFPFLFGGTFIEAV